MEFTHWIIVAMSSVLGLLAYLLRGRVDAVESGIKLLFKKHDDDVTDLANFKLRIAQDHYIKSELDARFDRLEETFKEGFSEIGKKFDKLSDILIEHIQSDRSKP